MKLFLFTLLFTLSSAFAQGIVAVANITKIQGSATINNQPVTEGQEVASGMQLKLGKKDDYVDIKFQNGHKVRLTGATVKVLDLNPKSTVFELLSGTLYAWTNKLTNNERFRIQTKYASFAVREAKFYLEQKKNESYLFALKGYVQVEKKDASTMVNEFFDLHVSTKDLGKPRKAQSSTIQNSESIFNQLI